MIGLSLTVSHIIGHVIIMTMHAAIAWCWCLVYKYRAWCWVGGGGWVVLGIFVFCIHFVFGTSNNVESGCILTFIVQPTKILSRGCRPVLNDGRINAQTRKLICRLLFT